MIAQGSHLRTNIYAHFLNWSQRLTRNGYAEPHLVHQSGAFEPQAGGSATMAPTTQDFGRRRAVNQQAQAAYDQTVASYRQIVLTGFQQVEDNLAALRILEQEARTQDAAVAAAQQALTTSTNRYKGGVTSYLEVITAQSAALSNETTAVNILGRRMTASILLIEALGGGWNASALPSMKSVSSSKPAVVANLPTSTILKTNEGSVRQDR